MDKLVEKCLLTKGEVNKVLAKKGSNIPSWVKWDTNHPDWQLLQTQLIKAIPIISEEIRMEERRDYERKLTLKEEMVTNRVSSEIKKELEEHYQTFDAGGNPIVYLDYKGANGKRKVTNFWNDYWRKRGGEMICSKCGKEEAEWFDLCQMCWEAYCSEEWWRLNVWESPLGVEEK